MYVKNDDCRAIYTSKEDASFIRRVLNKTQTIPYKRNLRSGVIIIIYLLLLCFFGSRKQITEITGEGMIAG